MNRILKSLFLLVFAVLISIPVQALTFDEAYNQSYSKPMVVLLYVDWAENVESIKQQYKTVASQLGSIYNFTAIDIAKSEAKSFNDRFNIYPKLPYAIMFRDAGKISRFIPRECVSDEKCLANKLQSFIK